MANSSELTVRPTWTKVVSVILAVLMVLGVGIGVVYGVQTHKEEQKVSAKEQTTTTTQSKVSSRKPIGYEGFIHYFQKKGYKAVSQSYDRTSVRHDIGMQSPDGNFYYIYVDTINIAYGEAVYDNIQKNYVSDISSVGKGETHSYQSAGYEKLTKKTKKVYYCLARINNQIVLGMSTSNHQAEVDQTIQAFGF